MNNLQNHSFLVIIGDINNRHFNEMIDNINTLGEVRELMDNVYLLITEEEMDYEIVRNKVSGHNMGYCMVISIKGLRAAWNLNPSQSKYLQSFFRKDEKGK